MTDLHTAAKQALEALEYIYTETTEDEDELIHSAITALRQALANEALDRMAENAREIGLDYEPVTWRNAAIRVGEELSSVGPDGYYDMTAEQWLGWAMEQRPKGKNSLPAQQEPVAWVCNGTHGHHDIDFLEEDVDSLAVGTQLYTLPQAREPLNDGYYVMQIGGGTKKIWPMTEEQALVVAAHGIKENT